MKTGSDNLVLNQFCKTLTILQVFTEHKQGFSEQNTHQFTGIY